jgi:hypothetical protein
MVNGYYDWLKDPYFVACLITDLSIVFILLIAYLCRIILIILYEVKTKDVSSYVIYSDEL